MNTGVKRTLFRKPAWDAPTTSLPDDSSIFGRSVVYDDILRAEQAKRERKAAKAKTCTDKEKGKGEGLETKRRRISIDDEDGANQNREEDSRSNLSQTRTKNITKRRDGPVTRSTPQEAKQLAEGRNASPRTYRSPRRGRGVGDVTVLDDDADQVEDDELVMLTPPKPTKTSPTKRQSKPPLDVEDSEEEDEYLRELKQKAREKARLQRQGVDSERSRTPTTSSLALNRNARSSSTEQNDSRPISAGSARESARTTPASEPEDDPRVKILIQSEIPNTRPLIVMRKASQSLKQVKEYWCMKSTLDESTAKKVFFTWKDTRLFDSTTMRGIIRQLKQDHYRQQSVSLDQDDEDDDHSSAVQDPSKGNIILEAMTQEIYENKMRQKEQGRKTETSADEEQEDYYEGDSSRATTGMRDGAEAEDQSSSAIVICLVSQTLEPMQLRVRPHTTVAKIMRGFAAMRKIEEGKTPWLIFDGDRLDPDDTVEQVGLENDDKVEVRIR
ncbi:uncharacterized protein Z518_04904 [Rhinocladiella mackenziei CBS 650.93]|uniref:Rhinocladiella mackenziei CBS 650.93 unplaced genomic scaffold supercont1.3, whole genome shotgun sequence n=1 Tax=Rhinocladiella mackenziei CBS 650.93 TaxID=1442369 RepID=A0A0D2H8X8_9EURO|nr:uncharacterized protein Z518_04904 [Rhinocladiella mackenziei CBS 650.93]KIX06928.1 hypothetical protein Z518_04904 [Rhinocladiella mackenziei CBS 650.93]